MSLGFCVYAKFLSNNRVLAKLLTWIIFFQFLYFMANPECSRRWWVHSWFSIWYWRGQTTFCQTYSLVPYTTKLFHSCEFVSSSITKLNHCSLLTSKLKLSAAKMGTNLRLTLQEYEKHCQKLQSKCCLSPSIKPSTDRCSISSGGHALRVYTDIPQVEEFLTRPEFLISMC